MVDHVSMVSVLAVLGAFGANALASWKWGADSRKDDGRPNW